MFTDIRLAFRSLLKSPGFTAVAAVILALGIGLNTSLFTIVSSIFLRPLACPRPAELVRIYRTTPQSRSAPESVANYLDLAREGTGTAQLAAFRLWSFTVAEPGRAPRMLDAMRVTAGYFPLLGVTPEVGRLFTPEEDRPGANDVVILSHALWATEFGADPSIVGRTVRLDGRPTTVVGVMPASFSAFITWGPAELWRPMGFTDEELRDRGTGRLQIIGRCAPGVSVDQAEARLRAIAAQLALDHPMENREASLRLKPLQSAGIMDVVDTFRQISWLTLGLAGSVLLITCANLANLQLGRALRRSREYAVCAALGGTRWRIMRPVLCECLMLALIGAMAALFVLFWTNDWLTSRLGMMPGLVLQVDWRVLAFAAGTALITGILFGLAPAWIVSRIQMNDVLRGSSRGALGGRGQSRLRSLLIVGQFALALLLLAGAGFFLRGTARLLARDPGWKPAGVLQGVVQLSESRYPTPERINDFYRRLQDELATLPGVEHVGLAWATPLYDYLQIRPFSVDASGAAPTGHEPLAHVNGITPGFLPTLGLPLLSGRSLVDTDDSGSPAVVLINETMARTLFPDGSAVGRRIRATDAADSPWLEIVGTVGDVRFPARFGAPDTHFQVYRPLAQDTWTYVTVAMRCSGSPAALAEPCRQAIARLDPDLAVQRLGAVPELIASLVTAFSFGGRLLGGLAALGLFLAALGIYGVIANLVVQRTPEIGIRLALGAPIRNVMWLVLGSGFRLALVGMALGLIGTYVLARMLGAIAPELPAQDPLVAVGVTSILMAVALLACWLPARRATRIDPMDALRTE